MPHNRLQLQGGVNETDTPVINTAGIAVSNRIRFKYEPLGLSLPEKLGGWGRFLATTITNGPIRALWAYQDTNSFQWLAWGTDNPAGAQLATVACTVDPTTGLTTATGMVNDLTPKVLSGGYSPSLFNFEVAGNDSFITVQNDTNVISVLPNTFTVYVTTPINIAGVTLLGMYNTSADSGNPTGSYDIEATDVLGNPVVTTFQPITPGAPVSLIGVTFAPGGGNNPNTLDFSFSIVSGYTMPPGTAFTVVGLTPSTANGSYVCLQSTSSSVTAATLLASYTYASGGLLSNNGVVNQFQTTAGTSTITVIYAQHPYSVGDNFEILNETRVGGIKLFGSYQVQSVIPARDLASNPVQSYSFTINAPQVASATEQQFQNALFVTGGTGNGTSVTLNYVNPYSHLFEFGSWINVSGVNPSAWNGHYAVTGVTATSVTFANTTAGSWVSGGSVSDEGGDAALIYSFSSIVGQTNPGVNIGADYWSLDNWGNDLLAVALTGHEINYPDFTVPFQPIYYWDATSGQAVAKILYAGPVACNGMFVATPERQIIAWGCAGPDQDAGLIDPLNIRWCDINNFNTWVAQVQNQAGSFRLSSGARIVGARQVSQQLLFFTDIEVWAAQYQNQPFVYGFSKIGQGCGLIGRNAHGVLGGITYWMSKTQFFMLSGDGVIPVPCPIWDVVFQDLDLLNVNKIVCAPNSMFQEITWYFPVKGGNGENTQYIKLNVSGLSAGQPPLWDYGTLDRSAWIDVSVLQQPIGSSTANQLIYQHEISPDADGQAMGEFFTTGWFALSEGDVMPFVDQIWPDLHWGYYGQAQNANVTFTVSGQDFPGQTAQTIGPYTINQATTYISPRMRHRLLSFTVSGTGTGTFWRLGGIRYRYQPDGRF